SSFFLFAFFLLIIGCTKEEIKPEALSEILIGRWEIVATVDPLAHEDTLWHEVSNRQFDVSFLPDSIATFTNSIGVQYGTYYTIGNDTISFQLPNRFRWIVLDFDESILSISKGVDRREGEFKCRFAKVD
ncbi:MAG: hypothetical protein AAGJ18_22400, partial [Bacteroidota bacterium]